MQERKNGLREGIARGLSQACVFCFEAQKTMLQVHGRVDSMSLRGVVDMMSKGVVTSAITSGIVFSGYFTVYHSIGTQNIWAGPVSAFTTSFLKIPISNSMRLIQAGMASNILDAGRRIVRARRIGGLYHGYGASLAEDVIEFDLRTRLYRSMRERVPEERKDSYIGLGLGAIAGSSTAWLTTPFDTIRAHMAVDAAKTCTKRSMLATAAYLYRNGGFPMLYRGATLRATSNAVKSALFYMFFETLTMI